MSRRCSLFIAEYIFLNTFILAFAFLFRHNFDVVTWMSIAQMLVIVVTLTLYKKDYMLVSILFILFTYLFHFGQSLITTLNFNDIYAHRNVLSKTTYETYINAELFAMGCLFFVGLGFLWANRYEKLRLQQCNTLMLDDDKMRKVRRAGLIVLAFSIIPLIYIDVSKILALKTGSYLDTYAVYAGGIGKYFTLIGQFARPAVTIVLFSYAKEKKKASAILFLSTIYFLIMMLSGDRGTNLIYIITNCFVYFKFVRKLRKREIILGVICCYVGFGFLSAISLFRYSEFSIESLLNVFLRRSDDGIIYSVLREFGVSLLSLVYALDFIPEYVGYNLGLTYISALVNILPIIPSSLAQMFEDSFAFTNAFPEIYQDSLGGSYLGELYYNFGWFGMAIAVFVGFFIGKVDLGLEKLKEPKYIAMLLVMVPSLILWVRDFFCSILFKSFWMAIFLLLF